MIPAPSELTDNKLSRLRAEVEERHRAILHPRLTGPGNDLQVLYRASCIALSRAETAAAVESVQVF